MTQKPNIQRLVALQELLVQFRGIKRMVRIPGSIEEQETDVEHSYALAMAAWFLAPHFPELDQAKIIRYALAHDLVEIHAGDTFAFADQSQIDGKKAREEASAAQLRADWPDFPDLHQAIDTYERKADREAKFVYALDKIMPAILNYLTDGYVWKAHHITFEQFRHEKETKIPVSPEVYEYYEQLRALLEQRPDLFPAIPSQQR